MNMQSLIVVNGTICEQVSPRVFIQYGRRKQLYQSGKIVEKHVLNGKFRSTKLK